jgi:phospholipase C
LPVSAITRRELVLGGLAAGAGVAAVSPSRVLDRVLAATAATGPCASLSAIEHVVFLINENRSFDSYFGTYRGVRGFADPHVQKLHDGSGLTVFAQPFPGQAGAAYGGYLLPFRFDTNA